MGSIPTWNNTWSTNYIIVLMLLFISLSSIFCKVPFGTGYTHILYLYIFSYLYIYNTTLPPIIVKQLWKILQKRHIIFLFRDLKFSGWASKHILPAVVVTSKLWPIALDQKYCVPFLFENRLGWFQRLIVLASLNNIIRQIDHFYNPLDE